MERVEARVQQQEYKEHGRMRQEYKKQGRKEHGRGGKVGQMGERGCDEVTIEGERERLIGEGIDILPDLIKNFLLLRFGTIIGVVVVVVMMAIGDVKSLLLAGLFMLFSILQS